MTYYISKVAQMFGEFWDILKTSLFKKKTCRGNFRKIGPLFNLISGRTDWASSGQNPSHSL